MPVFRLVDEPLFPAPELAEPDGLLAVGGDLSPVRLLTAYAQGIFPWYAEGDPLLWWSPAPRLVLLPAEFHLPRRLRHHRLRKVHGDGGHRLCRSGGCLPPTASGRREQGTWITPEMRRAYVRLHELAYAHAVECWQQDELVGGLYGVCLTGCSSASRCSPG